MSKADTGKVALAVGLLLVASWLAWRTFRSDRGVSDKAFFYDLSQQKLFTAPRNAIPPIRGLDGDQTDAVRALVIATNGKATDKSSWTIAYLEMYSPELKAQMEAAQSTGTSPGMGRGTAQAHRFVRRLSDPEWYSMNTPEAEKIVSEWLTAGPNGEPALICTP